MEGHAAHSRDAAYSPRAVVVMGVTGCGKTSVGERVAESLGWPFVEGDALHPQANIDKMASGQPLTDADRWPWLDVIGAAVRERVETHTGVVASCSALRRVYRERLVHAAGEPLLFAFLDGPEALIAERLATRSHHFMPASLLRSQFETLERPAADELALTVSIDQPLAEAVDEIVTALRRAA